EITIPATLHVTAAPDLLVSSRLLDYGQVLVGSSSRLSFTISNAGVLPLNVTSIASDNAVFAANVNGFSLAPGQRRDVEVTFTPKVAASFEANLTVSSDDPDESQLTVALRGTALPAPVIEVSPTSLAEELETGQSAVRTLTIQNSGGSPLEFEITVESSDGSHLPFHIEAPTARGDSGVMGVGRSIPLKDVPPRILPVP